MNSNSAHKTQLSVQGTCSYSKLNVQHSLNPELYLDYDFQSAMIPPN